MLDKVLDKGYDPTQEPLKRKPMLNKHSDKHSRERVSIDMSIEEIQALMEQDSIIKQDELDKESIKIPYLHSKWYGYFIEEYRIYKGAEMRMNEYIRDKSEYYMGKAPDEVYLEKPLHKKILKQELDMYLNSDAEIQKVRGTLSIQKMKMDMIESFLKQISNRSFQIKNAIEFMRFKQGG